MEVWNGVWNVDDELTLRIWHQLLRHGRRIAAVGGSDSHVAQQPVGRPQTVVNAADLSAPALVDGLRSGRSYLAESSAVTLELSASLGRGLAAGPGETLLVTRDAAATVTASVSGAPDAAVAIITDTGCVARVKTDSSGAGTVKWTGSGADASFARVEVRRAARGRFPSMVAMSNPVWLRA
jgi:hypothetical protein